MRPPLLSNPSLPKLPPLAVGRYELIGRGGIGIPEVHRARDPEGGLVAVYLFPDDPETQANLYAALESAAALDHPNVLRVFDAGREAGHGYLVTEWVEGTTLARMLEMHGRLPEANVIRILAQVGQAMDAVRREDVAPCRAGARNILVRTDGVAKVITFALPADRDTPAAPAVLPLKTQRAPAAPPPPAPRPTAPKPVPFPDLILSLGATLYEALTGAVWSRPEPSTHYERRRRPKPRPVGLTERTEKAIARSTHADPAKRPASCAEFVKLLRPRAQTAGTPKPDARPASASGENRRGFVRYAVGAGATCTINTSVFGDDGAPGSQVVWPLVVQDVSASGIGILLARRCEPGTELAIEVPGAERAARSLSVRVVRVRKDNFGHWMHGCAFLTPLEEPELLSLVSQLGRNDPA